MTLRHRLNLTTDCRDVIPQRKAHDGIGTLLGHVTVSPCPGELGYGIDVKKTFFTFFILL